MFNWRWLAGVIAFTLVAGGAIWLLGFAGSDSGEEKILPRNPEASVQLNFAYTSDSRRYASRLICRRERVLSSSGISLMKAERGCALLVKSGQAYGASLAAQPPVCTSAESQVGVRIRGWLDGKPVDRSYYGSGCRARRQDMAQVLGLISFMMPVDLILADGPEQLLGKLSPEGKKAMGNGLSYKENVARLRQQGFETTPDSVGPTVLCRPGQKSLPRKPCLVGTP